MTTRKMLPAVKAEHLAAVNAQVAAMGKRGKSVDVSVAAIVALQGKLDPALILSVLNRLFALNALLQTGELKHWIGEGKGKDVLYLEPSLLKAAARAPLQQALYLRDLAFQKDSFLQIVLEEAHAAGTA